MMDDPRINFEISQRGAKAGVDHLGFQVDSDDELRALREQVAAAEIAAVEQPDAECCYARSDKYWSCSARLASKRQPPTSWRSLPEPAPALWPHMRCSVFRCCR
jgi:hypothetical protein